MASTHFSTFRSTQPRSRQSWPSSVATSARQVTDPAEAAAVPPAASRAGGKPVRRQARVERQARRPAATATSRRSRASAPRSGAPDEGRRHGQGLVAQHRPAARRRQGPDRSSSERSSAPRGGAGRDKATRTADQADLRRSRPARRGHRRRARPQRRRPAEGPAREAGQPGGAPPGRRRRCWSTPTRSWPTSTRWPPAPARRASRSCARRRARRRTPPATTPRRSPSCVPRSG